MPEHERERSRRQFKCSNCDGRAWRDDDDPDVQSVCRVCEGPGELVPEGAEIQVSQFQCMNRECDTYSRAWYWRAKRSNCNTCQEYGVQVPEGEEVEWRQFHCVNVNCNKPRWIEMAERSKCPAKCGQYGEMIPKGEEIGVYFINFKCSAENCTNEYRVRCTMSTTAVCYDCRRRGPEQHNRPYGFQPLRGIRRKTDNVHGCDDCNGPGNCKHLRPNAVTYGPRGRSK